MKQYQQIVNEAIWNLYSSPSGHLNSVEYYHGMRTVAAKSVELAIEKCITIAKQANSLEAAAMIKQYFAENNG